MNIGYLEYFIKVASVKSISKVSQQSHISQSALSQIIQKIEEDLGYELFTRSNKGVELNEMGRIVYDYAEVILKTFQKMKGDLESMANNQCNVIINSTWSISNYSLPRLLVEVKDKYPFIHYELRSNRSEDVILNVLNGLVDFGIIYGDPNSTLLTTYPFGEDEIVLVSNKFFDIPAKITIDELFTYSLINFKHGCYYTDIKQSISQVQHKFIDIPSLLSLDSISAVKSAVLDGFGLSFLPLSSVKEEINDGKFKCSKVENLNLKLKVNIITLQKEKVNISVAKVIDLFLKYGHK